MGVRRKSFRMSEVNYTSSDTSASSSSSSTESDNPLKRLNRLLRSSVARRWYYFRRERPLRVRGRSVSDAGLCSIVEQDPDLCYLDVPQSVQRRSFHGLPTNYSVPKLYLTSAGGATSAVVAGDVVSDGSDDQFKRVHHLRVPTPACLTPSTGNFANGAGGGACGGARSAPATPLQLEPQPRPVRHEKQTVKLSSSTPSVRAPVAAGGGDGSDASESGKAPSKARQKKFFRHFPQVPPDERVLNYYSCALVGDILLQGHLYITKNYFAFYSNVFGYVTKLLIPTASVVRVSKEKLARIIPNAISVCTRDERHVFGSLLSRDATHRLMTRVCKAAKAPPQPPAALRISECSLDASEYSVEDESSSGGGGDGRTGKSRRTTEAIVPGPSAVIQPALLTGGGGGGGAAPAPAPGSPRLLLALAALLALTAAALGAAILKHNYTSPSVLSGEQLMSVWWRRGALAAPAPPPAAAAAAAAELDAFLSANLLLLAKVRQSLQTLSDVLLQDIPDLPSSLGVPNDTAYS